MPEISRFFGIVVKMFFDDHNPPLLAARREIIMVKARVSDGTVILRRWRRRHNQRIQCRN